MATPASTSHSINPRQCAALELPDGLASVVRSTGIMCALMAGWARLTEKHLRAAIQLYGNNFPARAIAPVTCGFWQCLNSDQQMLSGIADFIGQVNTLGWSSSGDFSAADEHQQFLQLLIDEGMHFDFMLTLEHRRALDKAGDALVNLFNSEGAKGTRNPRHEVRGVPFNKIVNFLILVETLPQLIINQANQRTEVRDLLAVSGRALALGVITRSMASEPAQWQPVIAAGKECLSQFISPKISDVGNDFKTTIDRCKQELIDSLNRLDNWSSLFAGRSSAASLIDSVSNQPNGDELYLSYIDVRTPYHLAYHAPVAGTAGLNLSCTLKHPWAHFELHAQDRSGLGRFSWMIDSAGVIRHSYRLYGLPFSEVDFGVSAESFDNMAQVIRNLSVATLTEIGQFVDANISVLSDNINMPTGATITLNQTANGYSILASANGQVLANCLLTPNTSQKATLDPETPETLAEEIGESGPRCKIKNIHEAFNHYGRPTFRQLIPYLQELGVSHNTGSGGSHFKLTREGMHYTTGTSLRRGNLQINAQVVSGILKSLNITESAFLGVFLRKKQIRTSHNPENGSCESENGL